MARDLVNAGAAAVMPLASPIGSNKGLCTRDFIQILIDEVELPIIVDAGIGKPSEACAAMEMGAAAIMANTALATAGAVNCENNKVIGSTANLPKGYSDIDFSKLSPNAFVHLSNVSWKRFITRSKAGSKRSTVS